MNNVLRPKKSDLIISHGGTEKWERKENQAAAAKADKVEVEQCNVQDVGVLFQQIKQRNTQREFQQ